ncbi:MAG TPA: IS30 family transposase [Candidatus Paceibacterota bacterium]
MLDKRKFKQLTAEKRWKLHELRREGHSMRECGRRLGVDVSTISRELNGKSAVVVGGPVYLPDHAQLVTNGRRAACHPHLKMNDPTFRRMIIIEIQKGRSPEIIAGRLKREHSRCVISAETLYGFIYNSEIGKRDKLYEYLPRGKKRRTKRKGRKSQKHRLEGRVFVEARSKAADERSEIGHWETDSVLCRYRDSVNVLAERMSRKVIITKLEAKDAAATTAAITSRLEHERVASITADNGPENAGHRDISKQLSVDFFFCHPYHSWEKGTVENRNGVIRRYLPSSTNLRTWTQGELDEIADDINNTPMKCLDFQTPNEFYWCVSPHGMMLSRSIK